MLHAVIGLSKVHEGCKQRLLLESGPVNEVAQSKQLMLCGHTWPEARLARSSQASFLSPADNAAVEDGSIQPAERLSHCNRPIVGGVALVPLLEDRGHKGRLDIIREDATMKRSIENGRKGTCKHMELQTFAILVLNLPISIAQQLRRPALPCPRPIVVEQRQG